MPVMMSMRSHLHLTTFTHRRCYAKELVNYRRIAAALRRMGIDVLLGCYSAAVIENTVKAPIKEVDDSGSRADAIMALPTPKTAVADGAVPQLQAHQRPSHRLLLYITAGTPVSTSGNQ